MLLLLLGLLASPDAVFLEHSVTLDCSNPDSGYIESSIEVVVPLTARGIRRYSQLSASYRNTWESLDLRAWVHHWRPGRGYSDAVVTEEPHDALLLSGRLESSLRELTIEFPGIEIGDTLFIEINRNISRLPMADFYSYTFFAASSDSICRGSFIVDWPLNMRINIQASDLPSPDTSIIDDSTIRYSWRTGSYSAISSLPFSRGIYMESPSVSIASHAPAEVSAGLHEAFVLPSMRDDLDADSILAACDYSPDRISQWISSEILYLSGDWGDDPGYSPRLPSETLGQRSGICRDQAILLHYVLMKAGFNPMTVLTSISGSVTGLVGSRSFDHMMVAYVAPDGDTVFLDSTNPSVSGGFTYSLRGSSYLPLTAEGSPLHRFPDDDSEDSLIISFSGLLWPDSGFIQGTLDIRFSGAAEELFRSMLGGVPVQSRQALMQTLFGALNGSEFHLSCDPFETSSEFSITGTGKWDCGVLHDNGFLYIILPGLETFDLVSSRASAFILPTFRHRLLIETPFVSILSMNLLGLPRESLLPEDLSSDVYGLNFGFSGDTLRMAERLSLLPSIPDSSRLAHLRDGLLARSAGILRTVVMP